MSKPVQILLALGLGLALGIAGAAIAPGPAARIAEWADPIGTAWLNGLRMTIVPLVVALLITGIAAAAEAARASRLAGRTILLAVALLWLSSLLGALATLALLDLWPLPESARMALRASFAAARPAGPVPGFAEFLGAIVPTNPVAAAANDAFLPLILFTTVFAFAVTRLPEEPRATMTRFFQALADAMLVVIGWVLRLAPIGVFALALVVGARAGGSAIGALIHYVLIVGGAGALISLLAYPLARFGGRLPLSRYVRAVAPAQAVALSTQSSLASLPAMLAGAEQLGIPVRVSGVTLPLLAAIFRFTGPAMNLAVPIYIAHVFAIPLGPGQIAAGIAAAAMTTMGAVSLPGQISFVSSIAPVALAMGLPIEPLAILVAVETLPDIVRTIGNVMANLAVTATIAARGGALDATPDEADALLRQSL